MTTKTAETMDVAKPQIKEQARESDDIDVTVKLKEGREKLIHELKKVIVGQDEDYQRHPDGDNPNNRGLSGQVCQIPGCKKCFICETKKDH